MPNGQPKRNVLVLTGAGASVNLGVDDTPLPMMTSWATSLVGAMEGWAPALGISADMPGDKFEEALGRFLAFQRTVSLGEPYVQLGLNGPQGTNLQAAHIEAWLVNAKVKCADLRKVIWRNLFECFGAGRVDDSRARTAYEGLHQQLRSVDGDGPECYIWHATTNFDTAIESAVEQLPGLRLVDGFIQRPGRRRDAFSANLLTDSILDSTQNIPVLHLHGAVGWYIGGDGQLSRRPADEGYDERMTPALLLPDNTKDAAGFDGPTALVWEQFVKLANQATHILVLGHSLHDAHIVNVLRESPAQIGYVCYQPQKSGEWVVVDPEETKRINNLVQGKRVSLMSGDFDPSLGAETIDPSALRQFLLADY